ncbi:MULTISPECIES: helix-turn-helix domain-containing protein [unclassified Streptomyces]|uniref:helix-turn-helix domain-containing protein n=1 Tax=unclassified Streptomyces TaxID=2593676 RepID=UPI000DAE66E3|nr:MULTISPECIES: helix-turn-helix transcriptional regulator [unclassified Streptomyces]PZT72118.1 XRE family transcriptional regulator [Streptomyces sp. AC1-42T]PZT81559.1 XRE family transcriptional regulator [Streptomyces sp. AC1-42W]
MNNINIGRALRELREAGGRQAKVVARSAVMSPSKLSKIENEALAPSVMDVERILTALEVSEEVKARLTEAARKAATEATAWRILRRTGLHKHQDEIRAIEAQTSLMRLFQPSCFPGLLQTPEYARAILGRHGYTQGALEKMMGARLLRQEVLHDTARTFRFVITESVLRWKIVRPSMLAAQLDKLITMSRMPNVSIGVLPLSAPMTDLPSSSFVLFDTNLAIIEIPHAEITTTEARDVELYVNKFAGFEGAAVTGEEMRRFVAGLRDDFLRQQETG